MEKFKKLPKNFVKEIKYDETRYQDFDGKVVSKYTANVNVLIVINNVEDLFFLDGLKLEGLEYISKCPEMNFEKFKYVINEGMVKLPILLKHSDPEIAKIAWVLAKYFGQRNDIITERVIE